MKLLFRLRHGRRCRLLAARKSLLPALTDLHPKSPMLALAACQSLAPYENSATPWLITRIAAGRACFFGIAFSISIGALRLVGNRPRGKRDALRTANLGWQRGCDPHPALVVQVGIPVAIGQRSRLSFSDWRTEDRPARVNQVSNLLERKRRAVIAVDALHRTRHAHRVKDRLLG